MIDISPISDEYTGIVPAPNHPIRRITAHASIIKMSVGPMDNNTYLITCTETNEQLLIDAANDATAILALLRESPGTLHGVLTTHGHIDHWQALEKIVESTGVSTMAGRADAKALPIAPDKLLDDGDEINVGNLRLRAIHLTGHTEGSIAVALRDPSYETETISAHLFTGDCLFPGGIGKTWKPGDFERLLHDVETKLFASYPDNTAVYPGHGNDTMLGKERPKLSDWRVRGW